MSDRDATGPSLPAPPGRVGRWAAAHRPTTDVVVALLAVAVDFVLTSATSSPRLVRGTGAIAVIAPLLAILPLLLRRRAPRTAAAAVLGIDALLFLVGAGHVPVAVMVCLATVVIAGQVRAAWTIAVTGVLAVTLMSVVVGATRIYPIVVSLAILLAIAIGAWIAARRRYLAALVELAERLAVERDQQAQLAVAAERTRIAREMHDIVSHGLAVMIRLADGASAVAASAPEQSAAATARIGEVGRASLGDMRRVLGVLGDGTPPGDRPQPTLADLDGVVENAVAAGLPVTLEVVGDPAPTPGGALVVHRAVQEGLTNALRYAGAPTRVRVSVDGSGPGIVVTVTDDGTSAPAPRSQGSGRGLVGLRERAAMYGGSVEAHPGDGGGWVLRVSVPQAEEAGS